jgi:nitrite reductase/ring-hydroxylating ferredoxin subunit
MASKYEVCFADEIPVGGRKIVDAAGRSVGVFNIDNRFYAVRNSCPHRGAPLCLGAIDGYVRGEKPGEFELERTGEILRCPWHGWEFDLKNGESVFNPHNVWVRSYTVSVETETRTLATAEMLAEERDPSIETYAVSVETVEGRERPVLYVHV